MNKGDIICISENCSRPIKAKNLCKYHLRVYLKPKYIPSTNTNPFAINNLNQLFKEIYGWYWEDKKEQIKYDLIQKYNKKVSERLIKEAKELGKKAAEAGKTDSPLAKLIPNTNPFLSLVPKNNKDNSFYNQPIILGLTDGKISFMKPDKND